MKQWKKAESIRQTLSETLLFSALGEKDQNAQSYARNWDHVLQSILSDDWLNTRLDARGDITSALARQVIQQKTSFEWNEINDAFRSDIAEIVYLNSWRLYDFGDVPVELIQTISYDLCFIVVISECDFTSAFIDTQYDLYLKGHLPCGWIGTYPHGKMLVF